jgi:hypothetical protein
VSLTKGPDYEIIATNEFFYRINKRDPRLLQDWSGQGSRIAILLAQFPVNGSPLMVGIHAEHRVELRLGSLEAPFADEP